MAGTNGYKGNCENVQTGIQQCLDSSELLGCTSPTCERSSFITRNCGDEDSFLIHPNPFYFSKSHTGLNNGADGMSKRPVWCYGCDG